MFRKWREYNSWALEKCRLVKTCSLMLRTLDCFAVRFEFSRKMDLLKIFHWELAGHHDTCNPTTQEAEEDYCKFEASLGYIVGVNSKKKKNYPCEITPHRKTLFLAVWGLNSGPHTY
jgi:hypothetical protein